MKHPIFVAYRYGYPQYMCDGQICRFSLSQKLLAMTDYYATKT